MKKSQVQNDRYSKVSINIHFGFEKNHQLKHKAAIEKNKSAIETNNVANRSNECRWKCSRQSQPNWCMACRIELKMVLFVPNRFILFRYSRTCAAQVECDKNDKMRAEKIYCGFESGGDFDCEQRWLFVLFGLYES